MKTNKTIRVKYSPVFEEQLKELREAIQEKDNKFDKQLLKAIEREKENLLIDMHKGTQIPKDEIPKEYITWITKSTTRSLDTEKEDKV
jgi:adenylate kinase